MDRAELEKLDRESLVQRAQAAGLKRARVLTRPELIDELVRLDPQLDGGQLKRTRGFFGLARDLLSRVVERGLHLPDAADRFRQVLNEVTEVPRPEAQAIPTVTLAEIYAAQGHKQRAIETLERVLESEPEHLAARTLLEKLTGEDYVSPRDPLPPEPDYEEPSEDEEEDEPLAEEEEDDEQEPLAADEVESSEPVTLHLDDEEMAVETPRVISEPVPVLRRAPIPREEPESEDVAAASVPEPPTVALPAAAMAQLLDDRCIAIGSYIWWQLSPSSLELAQESFFFVRIVSILPSWDGPQVAVRDVAADPNKGELVMRDLPRNAVVRVAIGFMPEGEFIPVAHSPALELGAGDALEQWTLDAVTPNVLGDPLVVAAAQRAATTI